jgi:peptidyl-prolyl cis-trans isomerase A (cyclophilin A)
MRQIRAWQDSLVTTYATLHTTKGDIKLELFEHQAPKTVRNFVGLAEGTVEWKNPATGKTSTDPLYDGVVFHRVIPGFMVQTGDPLGRGTGGPGYQFADEFSPEKSFDKPYLLAMANSGPNTNGSQFFITVAATGWLNGKHSIFGEVVDQAGRDVVDQIVSAPTGRNDKPKDDVVIESVSVERVDS